jgi:hypothetical protein
MPLSVFAMIDSVTMRPDTVRCGKWPGPVRAGSGCALCDDFRTERKLKPEWTFSMSELGAIFGLLTFCVSVGVALVGYAQWRTANQKVVLDLHEKRIKVYDQIEDAIASVMRHGSVADDVAAQFARGRAEARFLFGPDVLDYLQSVWSDVTWIHTYTPDTIRQSPNPSDLFNKRTDTMIRVSNFFTEAPNKFAPYIRMDQKNTPFWRPW